MPLKQRKSTRDEHAPVRMQVNDGWFRDHLARIGMSQRELASRLPTGPDGRQLDPAAITMMWQGRRRMKPTEAVIISKLFGTTVEDVLRQAGVVDSETDVEMEESIPVKGWVDAAWIVHWGEARGPRRAARPVQAGANVEVVRVCVDEGPHRVWDGSLAYYHSVKSGVDSGCLGRLCLVRLKGEGAQSLLREVRKGYSPGTYRLATLGGQVTHEEVKLESAAVIFLMAMG